MPYDAVRRTALAMGYPPTQIVTYTLESETGVSLRAAGWRFGGPAGGGSWSRPFARSSGRPPRRPQAPLTRSVNIPALEDSLTAPARPMQRTEGRTSAIGAPPLLVQSKLIDSGSSSDHARFREYGPIGARDR
jgi:hypothetical protein